MKVKIEFPYGSALLLGEEHVALVGAILTGSYVKTEGYGADRKIVASTDKPTVEMINEAELAPLPEPLLELQKRAAAAEKRWYEIYTEKAKSDAKAKELQAKLDAITNAAQSGVGASA